MTTKAKKIILILNLENDTLLFEEKAPESQKKYIKK